jgi:predicted nucleotidyltransferase
MSAVHASAIERKRRLEEELARFVRLLAADDSVERVIVFGSLVTGHVHEWSDIDMVVVKKTDLRFIERLKQIRRLLRPRVGTDVLVYTPQEFDELRRTRRFVREEVIGKGLTLYERRGEAVCAA